MNVYYLQVDFVSRWREVILARKSLEMYFNYKNWAIWGNVGPCRVKRCYAGQVMVLKNTRMTLSDLAVLYVALRWSKSSLRKIWVFYVDSR